MVNRRNQARGQTATPHNYGLRNRPTEKRRKGAMVILGFNRHVQTDIDRAAEVSKEWDVFTISRSPEIGRADHLFAYFSDIGKGAKSMILRVVREKAQLHNVVDVHLDYWWPANGYFADSYGLGWFLWVELLLAAGAREVILPYNDEVRAMEQKSRALVGEHISKQESTLWCATEKTASIPSAHNQKKMRGLHEGTPFIRFTQGALFVCVYLDYVWSGVKFTIHAFFAF